MIPFALQSLLTLAAAALGALLLSYGLTVLLRPLLVRYALARPNARSSHFEPVPQGGGVAVIIAALVAAALLGAMIGFAPFNKPVARLFLGDMGSLPIGLLLLWLLCQVAGKGHLAAAVLLPLYYVADATITLARRIANGERVWEA